MPISTLYIVWPPLRSDIGLDPTLLSQLDTAKLPQHLAIVMDGNGRWAQRRSLPRNYGHRPLPSITMARRRRSLCAMYAARATKRSKLWKRTSWSLKTIGGADRTKFKKLRIGTSPKRMKSCMPKSMRSWKCSTQGRLPTSRHGR